MHKDISVLIPWRTDGHHHSQGGLTGPEEIVTSEQWRRGLQRVTLWPVQGHIRTLRVLENWFSQDSQKRSDGPCTLDSPIASHVPQFGP